MSPVGFEHATPTSEQPQTHALDRVDTGIGVETEVLGVKKPVLLPRFHYKSLVECPRVERSTTELPEL